MLKMSKIKTTRLIVHRKNTCTSLYYFAPASSKEFLDIQATIECRFTLKCVRDITRTYSLFIVFYFSCAMCFLLCTALAAFYADCFVLDIWDKVFINQSWCDISCLASPVCGILSTLIAKSLLAFSVAVHSSIVKWSFK